MTLLRLTLQNVQCVDAPPRSIYSLYCSIKSKIAIDDLIGLYTSTIQCNEFDSESFREFQFVHCVHTYTAVYLPMLYVLCSHFNIIRLKSSQFLRQSLRRRMS